MIPAIQNKQFETILAIKYQKELMPITNVGEDAWKWALSYCSWECDGENLEEKVPNPWPDHSTPENVFLEKHSRMCNIFQQ